MTEKIYSVVNNNGTNYLCAGPNAKGNYIRRECHDGTITFLPVKMPEQPITCQQGTPLGGIEK